MSGNRFRVKAWSRDRAKWASSVAIQDGEARSTFFGVPTGMSTEPDVALMQSTGLLDKNGKEIFEGDIIRECTDTIIEHDYFMAWLPEHALFCARQIERPASWEHFINTFDLKYVEVIGNIYEHPGLLKGEK